jgi:hypothetical protein
VEAGLISLTIELAIQGAIHLNHLAVEEVGQALGFFIQGGGYRWWARISGWLLRLGGSLLLGLLVKRLGWLLGGPAGGRTSWDRRWGGCLSLSRNWG